MVADGDQRFREFCMMRAVLLVMVILALPPCALAAENQGSVAASDLPPAAQVAQALRRHPLVRSAAAGVRTETANRERLIAGPHETSLTFAAQRKRDRTIDLSTQEYEVGIARPIRLPGKAAKDAELGAVGVEQAGFELGDALHETARLLLRQWFSWQREATAMIERTAQLAQWQRQHDVVQKRVSAGDAPRMESLLSEAQVMQAQSALAEAATRRALAENEFARNFPTLELPAQIIPAEPSAVVSSATGWRERILTHNHELAVARSAAKRAQLTAQRLEAERMPDPTLGLKLASERDGQDRIVGLQFSIPFSGGARSASARAGSAQADAAGEREALILSRVEVEAWRTLNQAEASHAQWRRLSDIAARMDENAGLLEKAWRLGEGQFIELQAARRQANEARLGAAQARLDANEARYRLLLDAHELWELDDATPSSAP
jgi:outer membrane protein TolC